MPGAAVPGKLCAPCEGSKALAFLPLALVAAGLVAAFGYCLVQRRRTRPPPLLKSQQSDAGALVGATYE